MHPISSTAGDVLCPNSDNRDRREWRQFLPTQVRFEGDSIRPGGHVQRSGLPRTHVYSQPPLRTEQSTDVPNTAATTHVTQRHQTHKTLHYISSLLYYVNLILFTLLLVHLILLISPHHSHHPRSHHLSLPLPFTPHLKLISFTNAFLHCHCLRGF